MRPRHDGVGRACTIEKLLDGQSAKLIATTPVASCPAATTCGDAWAWMQPAARDISVVLVSGLDELHYAARSPDWEGSAATLAEVAQAIPEAALLDDQASLWNAISALRENELCLVGAHATHIVTAADLARPAGNLWAFAVIMSFEDALTRLFPSLSHGLWRRGLSPGATAKLDTEIERRRSEGSFMSDEECLPLTMKVRLGAVHVAPLLGICKNQWNGTLCGSLADIGNDLAHGRPLGTSHGEGPRGAMRRLIALRDVAGRMWSLIDDRDHVWQAYLDTVVEFDDARPMGTFWMLSAQNPMDARLSDQQNAGRHSALCRRLEQRGLLLGQGWGRSPHGSGAWQERMALMRPGSEEEARSIAADFGQRAVFQIDADELVVIDVDSGMERGRREL